MTLSRVGDPRRIGAILAAAISMASTARAECPENGSISWRLDAIATSAPIYVTRAPIPALYRVCVSRFDGAGRHAQSRTDRVVQGVHIALDCAAAAAGPELSNCPLVPLPLPGDCADFGAGSSLWVVRTIQKAGAAVSGRACRLER
jgi:hypothetical protein